jgi:DNA processing protein
MKAARSHIEQPSGREPYHPPRPSAVHTATLGELLASVRSIPDGQQQRFGFDGETGLKLWYAGDASLLKRPSVAIVGTRSVSREGAARARRLARELVEAHAVVVSGLAKGVDTEALTAGIDAGGRVIAVIGTPIDRAYPAENKRLHETIYREHLLISQFEPGQRVFRTNFPERNKLMAALTDATVIIEASNTSGTLHQAKECERLGRWLFVARSLLENNTVSWPQRFQSYEKMRELRETRDVLDVLSVERS